MYVYIYMCMYIYMCVYIHSFQNLAIVPYPHFKNHNYLISNTFSV